MLYQGRTKVLRVEHKKRTVSGRVIDRDLPTQTTEFEEEVIGWFVVLEGNFSVLVGETQPANIKPGDEVIVTIERTTDE